MALRPVETPQEHVRTALHLLGELEHQLRVLAFMPERYSLVGLLAATRRQLWFAVAAVESRRSSPSWWVRRRRLARKRGWPVMMCLAVVASAARALGFVLGAVLWSTRAAVRLVRTLRAFWP